MNTTRKMSQEVLQFAIFIFQSATANCAMKIDSETIFIVTVTARVFVAEDKALSTDVAVIILDAVIVAESWRGW